MTVTPLSMWLAGKFMQPYSHIDSLQKYPQLQLMNRLGIDSLYSDQRRHIVQPKVGQSEAGQFLATQSGQCCYQVDHRPIWSVHLTGFCDIFVPSVVVE